MNLEQLPQSKIENLEPTYELGGEKDVWSTDPEIQKIDAAERERKEQLLRKVRARLDDIFNEKAA